MKTDGEIDIQIDRNDQANIESSQFCYRVYKGYTFSIVKVLGLQLLY